VSLVDDSTEVRSVCFDCRHSNPCDACVAARDWLRLFSLDQRVCFLLPFQLNSCIDDFLQRHAKCRGFISSMCIRNANFSLFVVKLTLIFVHNERQQPISRHMHEWSAEIWPLAL
jgi:hypothetical protein